MELLKAEIGRLNAEGSAQMVELEAALETARSKLSAYQSIEVHLNAAVEVNRLLRPSTLSTAQKSLLEGVLLSRWDPSFW